MKIGFPSRIQKTSGGIRIRSHRRGCRDRWLAPPALFMPLHNHRIHAQRRRNVTAWKWSQCRTRMSLSVRAVHPNPTIGKQRVAQSRRVWYKHMAISRVDHYRVRTLSRW